MSATARGRRTTAQALGGIASPAAFIVSTALVQLGARSAPIVMTDPEGYLPPDEANQLLEDAARAVNDDAIGLRVARVLPPGSLGVLDYALLINPTWGAGVRMLTRYYAVVSTRATLELEERGDEAALIVRRTPRRLSHSHWIDLLLGVIVERAKQALESSWRPLRVELAHDAPTVGTDYAEWFDAPVRFEAEVDRLVFERRWLDEPLRTGVGALAEMLEQRLAAIVPRDQDPLVIRTRQMVSAALEQGQDTSIRGIARKLAMSTRSLQRSLSDRGVSYTDLLDGVRHARVVELLRTAELSVAEIAARVGFADQSALFRAFRRWSGTTPRRASK
ncbi:MAG TPA: AraC family transcriptional regulator [Kofleriaceae bacterium]|jgi:AraC-like DNA-binding protein|nr:AraC family transcriptional regulator [Kofleriaceae bacterium]